MYSQGHNNDAKSILLLKYRILEENFKIYDNHKVCQIQRTDGTNELGGYVENYYIFHKLTKHGSKTMLKYLAKQEYVGTPKSVIVLLFPKMPKFRVTLMCASTLELMV